MLKPAERIRYAGGIYTVVRVNECAAYIRLEYAKPRTVRIAAKVDGQGAVLEPAREFTAHTASDTLTISPYACVERVAASEVAVGVDAHTDDRA